MEYTSDILICDGQQNQNGRSYNIEDVTFPNKIPLFLESPTGNLKTDKLIGVTTLSKDGNIIRGISRIDDESINSLIDGVPKMYTVSYGVGDEGGGSIQNFQLKGAFLSDDPSDVRLTPLTKK